MRPERRNVFILAVCQMLFGTGRSLLIATAPLVAYGLAVEKGLATLPTSLVVVGTALASIPAAMVMRRLGRRMGFMAGALCGAAGGALCAHAVFQSNLWLFDDTALVIEWHIFAMFAPGFFAGQLVDRFGEVRMIHAGILLQLLCVAVALSGQGVMEFWLANVLLGLGWCLSFTAATTLTTYAYTPAERDHTHGATNFIASSFVALLSLSSGALVHYFGWMWVNLGAVPLLLVASAVTFWYSAKPRALVAA